MHEIVRAGLSAAPTGATLFQADVIPAQIDGHRYTIAYTDLAGRRYISGLRANRELEDVFEWLLTQELK